MKMLLEVPPWLRTPSRLSIRTWDTVLFPLQKDPVQRKIILAISNIGCTHGRDSCGRRLLPVMAKDVAGLVPGAYQGRGRGNKVSFF